MFVVEPSHYSTVHAAVSGQVAAVLINEGEQVRAGQPLLRMNSSMPAAMHSSAAAETGSARFDAYAAEIRGGSIGTAAAEENAAARASGLARQAQGSLTVAAPANGTVLTPGPGSLTGQNVASGERLLTIADAGPHTVRVFIPAAALDNIRPGDEIALSVPGKFSPVHITLAPIGGDAVHLPEGLVARQNYKGIELPIFYSARMTLPASAEDLPLGMAGDARIFGRRRSVAERVATVGLDLVKAHVW